MFLRQILTVKMISFFKAAAEDALYFWPTSCSILLVMLSVAIVSRALYPAMKTLTVPTSNSELTIPEWKCQLETG
jgi:cytochrome bd-type quinol oxidase subunit 2